ncbi:hypothetical protein HTV45_12130 [Streptomyces sp. CHD11]|uniref:hypothetical protein n=1 Tax=Streptomyces sp. CHD11 TaxID=2741325 RepID=UPI001BFC02F1|nr:hypothetical protein [Streptomyces sp. CHD11]MBT3151623.1 hypothetical protein [Streptomyces sp. CHD11]
MVRRPVAGVVALVLFAEALGIAAVNWFLGVVVDRQDMSLAGLDPHMMSVSSKIGGIVFGLYLALCGLVALLAALRDRAPAGSGRVLLISAAVVHGLLGAFAWGLVGWTAFVFMVGVLGLIVLLLMTYDGHAGDTTAGAAPDGGTGGAGGMDGPGGTDGTGGTEGPGGPGRTGGSPLTPPAAPTVP